MTARIRRFLSDVRPATPCLVMDLDSVRNAFEGLAQSLPRAAIFYAMKANPAPEVLRLLSGARFQLRYSLDL